MFTVAMVTEKLVLDAYYEIPNIVILF